MTKQRRGRKNDENEKSTPFFIEKDYKTHKVLKN